MERWIGKYRRWGDRKGKRDRNKGRKEMCSLFTPAVKDHSDSKIGNSL